MSGQQIDLFLDSLINAPIKDDRALMEFPFFSLQKQPLHEPLLYDDGRVRIRVSPGERGLATIWDKDVLIYIASLINDRIERGLPVERTVRFAAHDFLKITGRGTSATVYEQLKDALFRLRSTTITTTIKSAGDQEDRGFGWIDNFRIVRRDTTDGRRVMAAVEVTLNDWMFRAVVKERRVLTINRAYFELTMGLERRLYELARKHLGQQPEWTIGLPRLAEKVGTARDLRKVKADLKRIIERDSLPDYAMAMVAPEDGARKGVNERTLIIFRPREGAVDMWNAS